VFTNLQTTSLKTTSSVFHRHRAVGLSVAAHLAVLAVLVFHSQRVIDPSPAWLAHGAGARAYKLTYFPPGADTAKSPEVARLLFTPRLIKPRPRTQPQPPAPEPQRVIVIADATADAEAGDHNTHAGSPLGTMINGPITGHEVHVAYPVVYPDPPVARAELPRDLQGDVVIEVTIDSQGNVVETKIVQAIGHGIDEKIEATLRRWHYQPATLDGTPVASRHDVHFHFPS
jgi:TonB family protein